MRNRRTERDPQASEAFDPRPAHGLTAEILPACDLDSQFLGRTARFLSYTGPHITVLTGGWRTYTTWTGGYRTGTAERHEFYQDPIDASALRGDFIYFTRPKNRKPLRVPVFSPCRDWLRDYLATERPYSRGRYNQLFDRVAGKIGQPINPLRFRHTFGVYAAHVEGYPLPLVQEWLGCTEKVMATYIALPPYMVAEMVRARGS